MSSPPGPLMEWRRYTSRSPSLLRQRTKQHAADDAEDRRVRADAETEREDDGEREAASARQASDGVAEVGDQHGRVRRG